MRHAAVTALLGPILYRQGRQVRGRINLLPEPPGARHGRVGSGPALSLLIVGDSAGAGVGAPHQAEALSGQVVQTLARNFDVQWRLAAWSGATIPATMRRLEGLPPGTWDYVIVSAGVNDVVSGHSLGRWRENLSRLRDLLHSRFGRPHILFSGLPPVHLFPALPQPLRWYLGARTRDFDRALARWVQDQEHCTRLPTDFPRDAALLATDGFHPGPGLYRLWGGAAADHIRAHRGV
jgi:lysophospholipase L1-like esterase